MPHVIKYEQQKWSEDYIITPRANTRLALQEGEVTGLTTCQCCYGAYIHLHMSHLVAPFHGCIWLFDILDTASLYRVRIVSHWVTKHWTARISSITPHLHHLHHHQQYWYGPCEWNMLWLYYASFPSNHLQMSNFQSLQKNSQIAIWHHKTFTKRLVPCNRSVFQDH